MPWLPCSYEDEGRPCRAGTAPCQRPQAPHRVIATLETIKSRAEITRLFEEGRRVGAKDFTIIVLRNEQQHGHNGRAAFVAGKKLGNAVWRNRAKRRLRAICREAHGPVEGYDMIFLAKRSTNTGDYKTMVESAAQSMERIRGAKG